MHHNSPVTCPDQRCSCSRFGIGWNTAGPSFVLRTCGIVIRPSLICCKVSSEKKPVKNRYYLRIYREIIHNYVTGHEKQNKVVSSRSLPHHHTYKRYWIRVFALRTLTSFHSPPQLPPVPLRGCAGTWGYDGLRTYFCLCVSMCGWCGWVPKSTLLAIRRLKTQKQSPGQ